MDFTALSAFLAELAIHNNKPWFDEHRPVYEKLRGDWLAFVGQVIPGIAVFDPSVAIVSPKDTQFRINRDIRFSADKRPYKTTFSAIICPQGRSSAMPAYYFQIDETAALLIAGGVHTAEPPILNQIRRYIAEHPERLTAVLTHPGFAAAYGKIDGERLKRPPQGYEESTPGIEHIKLKSFTAGFEPRGWLARADDLADEIIIGQRALFPFIGWLREALGGSRDLGVLSPQEVDRLAGS